MVNENALELLGSWESGPNGLSDEGVQMLVQQKFMYVVSCQIYGKMKREKMPQADAIDELLQMKPQLRVTYIDEAEGVFYSVLIKWDAIENSIVEVYRVRLPGNPIVGEGKPENQNHAIMFTRGEVVQTIDMNQDGFLEEAFKIRNLAEEFKNDELWIVGMPETIFTADLSSLAQYMAAMERTFVTLIQRTLDMPMGVRMHYGHPDLVNKIYAMTNGGVSKSNKGLNLNEDIFAAFNFTLRGGSVCHREYFTCGKGK
jgi:callose synthase